MSYIKLDELLLDEKLTVSICIPCIPKHVKCLNDLMCSINEQTIKPFEVIIFVSSYSQEEANNLQQFMNITFPCQNVIVGYTKQQQYAGPNRNSAAALSTGKILSFMDADDIIHPKRTEYIMAIFSTFSIDCLLHYYIQNNNFEEIFFNDDSDKIFNKINFSYQFSDSIQHGHPSFRREVFFHKVPKYIFDSTVTDGIRVEYIEEEKMQYNNKPRTQDFDFIMKFTSLSKKIAVLCKSLSKYRPEYSTLYGTHNL